eukprot:gene9387-6606_t
MISIPIHQRTNNFTVTLPKRVSLQLKRDERRANKQTRKKGESTRERWTLHSVLFVFRIVIFIILLGIFSFAFLSRRQEVVSFKHADHVLLPPLLQTKMPHLKNTGGDAYERWLQSEKQRKFMERLKQTPAKTDSSLPYSNRYRRPIQTPAVTTIKRDAAIEKENVYYYQHLDRMYAEPSVIDHHKPRDMHRNEIFMLRAREAERERVEEENIGVMQRILNTQTCYPVAKTEESYAANRVIANRIRRYEDTDEDED